MSENNWTKVVKVIDILCVFAAAIMAILGHYLSIDLLALIGIIYLTVTILDKIKIQHRQKELIDDLVSEIRDDL